jgi:hypothetical protein
MVGSRAAIDVALMTGREHSDEALVLFKLVDNPVRTAAGREASSVLGF